VVVPLLLLPRVELAAALVQVPILEVGVAAQFHKTGDSNEIGCETFEILEHEHMACSCRSIK
jgi:hypothetical protein